MSSLNTQSFIKVLLVVRDFCFWAVWAAGPVLKKKLLADYEQLLMFSGAKKMNVLNKGPQDWVFRLGTNVNKSVFQFQLTLKNPY